MPVKDNNKGKLSKLLRPIAFVALLVLLLIIYLIISPDISVQTLLNRTPEDPIAAAAVILVLYLLKSITVFFPLIVLEIASGHLFSTFTALFINLLGILIALTAPYLIGRAAGMEEIRALTKKYPKFDEIITKQQANSFFLCFFLRIISCLPGDIVSMYFGATETPFWKNLVAGALGLLPGMILATLIGESIQDPCSPMFWLSAGLMVALSALSVLFYRLYRRKIQKNGTGGSFFEKQL